MLVKLKLFRNYYYILSTNYGDEDCSYKLEAIGGL